MKRGIGKGRKVKMKALQEQNELLKKNLEDERFRASRARSQLQDYESKIVRLAAEVTVDPYMDKQNLICFEKYVKRELANEIAQELVKSGAIKLAVSESQSFRYFQVIYRAELMVLRCED